MSTAQPPDTAVGTAKPQQKQKNTQPTGTTAAGAGAAASSSTDGAPKKLTGAELKAQKQAEKAKRRAAVIAAKEAAGGVPPAAAVAAAAAAGQTSQSGSQPKQGKGKSSASAESGGGGSGGGGKITGPLASRPSAGAASAASAAPGTGGPAGEAAAAVATPADREKDARSGIPECFSHLPMAKRITIAQAHRDVHPAILAVGQQMASFDLRHNMARLEATLVAFKKVIASYQTPPGNAFSRHFVSHVLNPQIEYLTECRPMCFAMGNGIRLLKARVSQLDLDTDDADAIEELCDSIDSFVQERIFVAAVGIAREAASMIHDGDVVLTFGGPRLVCAALEQAWDHGVRFDLIVVNDPSDPAPGQALAKEFQRRATLVAGRTPDGARAAAPSYVTYSPSLDGIDNLVARSSIVLLGAEAVFANGALLAPAGTCDVASAASAVNATVIALCETVNFDRDRVATDALAHNEIDPDRCDGDAFRLLFDTTPSSLINMLICEYEEASGMVPAHAINLVLRTREDPN
ncbi:translation initiation factor eIF-2B subunit delta [Sporothrix schenckii 1099-18]|uniref:Translation initiation factor eIF2B subunit delta n=1 Tax=Sporothrix schenckii 1099-18 TaxID=1397361 RepID=A0A0F2M534_SPOSC|nr:translation initiation factor eIF-2B subunit delta [Sporothrix schenckii 1099-18]KJR83296.1 translation initiation factor eIF-2B subunit delta [Sporothrix schenckii 1099-18]